jgi:hypothetical protein
MRVRQHTFRIIAHRRFSGALFNRTTFRNKIAKVVMATGTGKGRNQDMAVISQLRKLIDRATTHG